MDTDFNSNFWPAAYHPKQEFSITFIDSVLNQAETITKTSNPLDLRSENNHQEQPTFSFLLTFEIWLKMTQSEILFILSENKHYIAIFHSFEKVNKVMIIVSAWLRTHSLEIRQSTIY